MLESWIIDIIYAMQKLFFQSLLESYVKVHTPRCRQYL